MVKELRLVQIKDIIPYTNNPRKNKDAVAAVKSSISEYGYKNIIAVDENMVILAGHTRLSALKELGWKECNVLVFDDLTEAQKKGYRIVDNKTNEFSFWDDELLKLEFDSLKELDFDLSLTGFSADEINALDPINPDDVQEVEPEDAATVETTIKRGNVILLGNHRLMCGDSTSSEDVGILMQDEKADLLLTDPPYNLSFDYNTYDDNKSYEEYKSFINNSIIKFKSIKKIITSGKQNIKLYYELFDITDIGVWISKNKMSGGKISNLSLWEPIIFIGKFDRNNRPTDIFEFNNRIQNDTSIHSCPKTPEFFGELIKSYTKQNDIIVDIFCGSGTTLIAADQLNRKCLMMELDTQYCEVICRRYEKLTGDKRQIV